jgi:hypothetical protein
LHASRESIKKPGPGFGRRGGKINPSPVKSFYYYIPIASKDSSPNVKQLAKEVNSLTVLRWKNNYEYRLSRS